MGVALRECPSLLIVRPRSVGQSLRSDGSCLRAIASVVPGFGMFPDRAQTSRIALPETRTFVGYPTLASTYAPFSGPVNQAF